MVAARERRKAALLSIAATAPIVTDAPLGANEDVETALVACGDPPAALIAADAPLSAEERGASTCDNRRPGLGRGWLSF